MGHNFHDMNGELLWGIDLHFGIQIFPLFGPMIFAELNFEHPFSLGPNPNATVLMNGVPSVKDGHAPVLLAPHLPFFPHALNLVFPLDIVFGTQRCWIPRLSVLAEGSPTAVTLFEGTSSLNLDCFLFTKIPSSEVLQPGTVETTPSPVDYAYGIGRAVVNAAFDALFFYLTGPIKTWSMSPSVGNYASAFFGNLLGRFSPWGWDKGGGWGNLFSRAGGFWALGATGTSPASLFGGLLDAFGVAPPGTQDLTWSDILGPAVGITAPAPGQENTDAGQVARNFLNNLFPPLGLLP